MSYTKTNWVNDQAPAINATNLNKIEQGIFNNDANISGINGTIGVDTNTWVGTTAYGEGDIVIYNDKIYQNISGTSTTTNPASDTTNWNEITIFDTDSINDDLIDKTKFINNSSTNSGVETYSCDYINDLVNYSTTEINTHQKWIDGKDIYRKVLTYDGSAVSTNIMINHNITNIGNYRTVKEAGFYYNGTWYYGYANSTSYAMFTGISSTAVDGYIGSSWNDLFSKIFVVIEYTKSS